MSERLDFHARTTVTLREQGWAPKRRQHYPPPQAVNQYSSRALPPPPGQLPPRTPSSSSSIYDSEEEGPPQTKSKRVLPVSQDDDGRNSATFGGAMDEEAFAMVRPPQIKIPSRSSENMDEHEHVVSPQPHYPDSKLVSLWEDGDELVSPIDTPGTANWKHHAVSPLSEGSEERTSSEADQVPILESDASLDDGTRDQAEQQRPSGSRQKNDHVEKTTFLGTPRVQGLKKSRFSDPGSPHSAGLAIGEYGEPGPDVGAKNRFDDASRRQTARRQPYAQSMYISDPRNHPCEMPAIGESNRLSFPCPEANAFSKNRPGVSPRPTPPPPPAASEQAVEGNHVKVPILPRTYSALPQKQTSESDEPTTKQQKRTSTFTSFGASFRSSIQRTERSSPVFEDILNKLDSNQNQGKTSPVPKVKNMLLKAKQGFGVGTSDDSKKEKRREELKRQIRLGNAE